MPAARVSLSFLRSRPLALAAVLVAALLAASLALWAHYGAAVFFEAIASGIAGCF